ncbi:MAG: tetratricopeptide repeat protein [Treponema sp.]|nr:tetratricopeptide repeat protein [Treponema sp.]
MKNLKYIIPSIIIALSLNTCVSTDVQKDSSSSDELGISARGAVGRMETGSSAPMYTGNGGSNIRLAVLAPEIQGDVPSYLPLHIQGLLNTNINRFSAINLIDRQNLNRIISEQNLAASGRFSDNDFVRIGNLTNTQFFLFGTVQRLAGNRFSLQLSITEASTGIRRASSMKEGTLMQLFEGRALLLNEATAELLEQMGVRLTAQGRQTLLAGNISTVQSQAGLARGITAQSDGSDIQALFNYVQAVSFDPSQVEALSRLSNISTTISGGTISQRILNDIQARDRWLEAFKEATQFFNDHPPFEILFDPNLIQIGETDFSRRTVTLGMRIALDHSKSGFDAINALLEGLERTGRRSTWGFSNWPLTDISPRTSGTVLFGGRQAFNCRVEVALINENGKRLGTNSINLNTEQIRFNQNNTQITPPLSLGGIISFPNIRAEDLTPTLTIVIVSVNGISSRNLSSSGYMRIETEDLEKRIREREAENLRRAQVFFEQGLRNSNERNYDQAIINLNQAIQLNPNFTLAFFRRAWSYAGLGNLETQQNIARQYRSRAIDDYTKVIQLDPNFWQAYHNRGSLYSGRRDFNLAIADFTMVIQLNSNNALAYNDRGIAYENLRQYRLAQTDYEAAFRIEPNNTIYRNNLNRVRNMR